MPILRKIGLGLLGSLFGFLLLATALDVGLTQVVTHPATVKRLAADSGIYNSVVPSILKQTKSFKVLGGTISADDPVVIQAANDAISPQYIKENAETTIDNIYKWLDGKSSVPDKPDIFIDLRPVKAKFAENLSTAVYNRLINLPNCTPAQAQAIIQAYNEGQPPGINANCTVPRLVNPGNIAGNVKSNILNSNFLTKNGADNVITADDFKSGNSNQSVFQDQLKDIPKQYRWAKSTLGILIILAILAAAGIIFLSSSRRRGVRRVGVILAIAGLSMLVLAWLVNYLFGHQVLPRLNDLDNKILQNDLKTIVADIIQAIDKNYWLAGAVYLAVGVAAIALAVLWRRQPALASTAASPTDVRPHPEKPRGKVRTKT